MYGQCCTRTHCSIPENIQYQIYDHFISFCNALFTYFLRIFISFWKEIFYNFRCVYTCMCRDIVRLVDLHMPCYSSFAAIVQFSGGFTILTQSLALSSWFAKIQCFQWISGTRCMNVTHENVWIGILALCCTARSVDAWPTQHIARSCVILWTLTQ